MSGGRTWRSVVALSGGVGGARLVDGLAGALPPSALTVVVNTGDDFVHCGLRVSPDLDTNLYTLARLAPEGRGWGLEDESFRALEMLKTLGGPGWFGLGDRDLGTHLARTEALARGETLTAVTARLGEALGVATRLLPMADAPRATLLETADGRELSFQTWLVRERAPLVDAVRFEGTRTPTPHVLAALEAAELVVIGPSNPYVSIDPILTLDGVRDAIGATPVVAVSPIVHGAAVKGPLAAMIPRLAGRPPGAEAIAAHYGGLLSGLVVEAGDEGAVAGLPVLGTATVMGGREDRIRLAREVLAFAAGLVG